MNASYRLNTCKSRGIGGVAIHLPATGARVSNTYPTCHELRDSPLKGGLIPDVTAAGHPAALKDSSVHDGDASD